MYTSFMDNKFAKIKPHFSSSSESRPVEFKIKNKQKVLMRARQIIREAREIREEELARHAPLYS